MDGNYRRVQVAKVADLNMRQIAVNIPLLVWPGPTFNPNFMPTIQALADSYDVVILFCRTGGRAWWATN